MIPGPRVWLVAGLLVVLACATRGGRFDVDSIPKIERDVTTQADIRRWFGEPVALRVNGSGAAQWSYLYEERTQRDTRTITRVWRSIASVFGMRVFFPPADVAYEKTTRHELEVYFWPDAVVRDYTYEREVIPSKRIY